MCVCVCVCVHVDPKAHNKLQVVDRRLEYAIGNQHVPYIQPFGIVIAVHLFGSLQIEAHCLMA